MSDYAAFLASKAPRPSAVGLDQVPALSPWLFDYQAACAAFALRQGRSGLFLDTGLGKTLVELEFAQRAVEATNRPALVLTPLAVARQIEREAARFGYDARVIREQAEARPAAISICNYDRLERLDLATFGAVVLDESSILKSFTGKTTRALTAACAGQRFKLAATATPAPNDHMELGQHAELLEVMPSNEMLMRWFTSDQTEMGRYRLKKHGAQSFWDWMASWSRCAATPEDLGFDGSRFVLPALEVLRHQAARVELPAAPGELFATAEASATTMHQVKRRTAPARAAAAAALVEADPAESWVLWVDTDYEADALLAALPGAMEVRGSHPVERKEERLAAFASGELRWLVTKPSVAGMGLNWQHCARLAFVGRSFSYEAWYQAVRRCWRFGQARPVQCHLIVAEGEDHIGRVIDRKAADHAAMKREMAEAMRRAVGRAEVIKQAYLPRHEGRVPSWVFAA